jgi:hypothetical protein
MPETPTKASIQKEEMLMKEMPELLSVPSEPKI